MIRNLHTPQPDPRLPSQTTSMSQILPGQIHRKQRLLPSMIISRNHAISIQRKRPREKRMQELLIHIRAQTRLLRRNQPLCHRLHGIQDKRISENLQRRGAAHVLSRHGDRRLGSNPVQEGLDAVDRGGVTGGDDDELAGNGGGGGAEDRAGDEGGAVGGELALDLAGGVGVDGGAVDDDLGGEGGGGESGDDGFEGGVVANADEDYGGVGDGVGEGGADGGFVGGEGRGEVGGFAGSAVVEGYWGGLGTFLGDVGGHSLELVG